MTAQAIIIEAGVRSRRLDAIESQPKSLDTVETTDRPVLDWGLHSLRRHRIEDVTYVGGYHIEKVIERYPELKFRYHASRQTEGELGALLLCQPFAGDCLILRADTLLLPSAIEALPEAPLVCGTYDSNGASRPAGVYRVAASAQKDAVGAARALVDLDPAASLDDLMDELEETGQRIVRVSLDGHAAPVTDRPAIARTIFKGKAQTLENLAPLSRNAVVLDIVRFAVDEWRADPDAVLRRLGREFADRPLVVRSSATAEDTLASSAAGKFTSVLGVDANDEAALRRAVERVIDSYGADDRALAGEDEVLVQPQVDNLAMSGVLLTRDAYTGAPYFVLNVDRDSGRPNLVTSGSEGRVETSYLAWSAERPAECSARLPDYATELVDLGHELMRLSHLDALNIEFGIDCEGVCHLFQARPLVLARKDATLSDQDLIDMLEHASNFIAGRMEPRPPLAGTTTLLGVMPDWNPAEMIGTAPRPLALSLYQTLIGDSSWAEARARIGYRDVVPEPLILSVGGRPYVDVRASLNSLLPAGLDKAAAGRWVDACLARLRAQPALHDKLEFEIALTCMAPDWEQHAPRLAEAGLDADARADFRARLTGLTNRMLRGETEPIERQLAEIGCLDARRRVITSNAVDDVNAASRVVRHLLDDCRRFGLVPFSILARYAFVSMAFLRGLRAVGAISADDYDAFLQAVPTISSEFSRDLSGFGQGRCGLEELVARYGHLRPNSYDITSPNYASNPSQYFRPVAAPRMPSASEIPEAILERNRGAIEAALAAVGIEVELAALARFLVGSIAGRERAKFEFMKNVDRALETIARLGEILDLDRERLSFLPVAEVLRLETDSIASATGNYLRRNASYHEKRWMLTRALRLPDLICDAEDAFAFQMEEWRANFITRKRIVERPVWLDEDAPSAAPADRAANRPANHLDDAIVVIRAADPGYDWVFAHRIAGLVTEYGGVASHMAIRAAEFGLPAAIGCGSAVFERLAGARLIELDCDRAIVRAAS